MCLFCEAYDGKRQIADLLLAKGQRCEFTAAIVERFFLLGHCGGRSTDYIDDGKGAPLNYCPTCGKKLRGVACPKLNIQLPEE